MISTCGKDGSIIWNLLIKLVPNILQNTEVDHSTEQAFRSLSEDEYFVTNGNYMASKTSAALVVPCSFLPELVLALLES